MKQTLGNASSYLAAFEHTDIQKKKNLYMAEIITRDVEILNYRRLNILTLAKKKKIILLKIIFQEYDLKKLIFEGKK